MRTRIRPALTALWTTAIVAAAANLLVLWGGVAANSGAIIVEQQGMTLEVGIASVIAASIVGAVLAALGALVLLRVFPRRGRTVFVVAGAALTLLSLAGTLGAATGVGIAALMIMHLVTGTVVVIGNAVIHTRNEARAPQSP